jgi:hypothetical protein
MDSMEIFSDYTEDDAYDWDRYDPRQYCRHGSFIGSWWGPDILCGDCEMGEDPTINEMINPLSNKKAFLSGQTDGYNMGILKAIETISELDIESSYKKSVAILLLTRGNEFSDEVKKKIASVDQSIQNIISEYAPLSKDWSTDREVLYKKHRKEIMNFFGEEYESEEEDEFL